MSTTGHLRLLLWAVDQYRRAAAIAGNYLPDLCGSTACHSHRATEVRS